MGEFLCVCEVDMRCVQRLCGDAEGGVVWWVGFLCVELICALCGEALKRLCDGSGYNQSSSETNARVRVHVCVKFVCNVLFSIFYMLFFLL